MKSKTFEYQQAEVLIKALCSSVSMYESRWEKLKELEPTLEIRAASPAVRRAVIRFTIDTINEIWDNWNIRERWEDCWYGEMIRNRVLPRAAMELCRRLLMQDLQFSAEELISLLEETAKLKQLSTNERFLEPLIKTAERFVAANKLSPEMRVALEKLCQAITWNNAPEERLRNRISTLISVHPRLPLCPGEAWSDVALADLQAMTEHEHRLWLNLIALCEDSTGSSPTAKWIKSAAEAVTAVGHADFKRCVLSWFPLVNKPRTQEITDWNHEYQPNPNLLIIESHADILKGMVWCCALCQDKEISRALAGLALSAYRKVPKIGPRAVKIGNACIYALGAMPGMEGLGQLALLKVRVKFGTAQKCIDKALTATAKRVGLPRDELEEMAVPAYGMTEVGSCEESMGEFTARISVTGSDNTELNWIKPDGKLQKSVPALVKAAYAEEFKELQAAARDIQRMLPAQRQRIDSLFLQQKSWPLAIWRERYLDHPLVGVIARRLIWEFTKGQKVTPGIFYNPTLKICNDSAVQGKFGDTLKCMVDLDLRPLADLGEKTIVRPWHPIGKNVDEIMAWRAWLDEQQIQQPFKQAHREVYLLTDAERNTRTYSNRYAAHVLRQHQFNALCAARGWTNKLRLMVDAEFPPATLYLPKWNLRAEFWIEGAGDDYGTDTNESGVFLFLTTDQVRFYTMESAQVMANYGTGDYRVLAGEEPPIPLPLEDIPPLVFSEVMRDIDLFVGVASVGNDPNWADGGPEGRYRDYWQRYSFGDLSATAKTRREVLARLLPRLKIANQCSLMDKFLVVKGSLRTYKIHLGSGNILMEPNDQYLCIVPKQSATAGTNHVLLPFEGDATFSVILSKALLLAEDGKIKDQSIVNQLKLR